MVVPLCVNEDVVRKYAWLCTKPFGVYEPGAQEVSNEHHRQGAKLGYAIGVLMAFPYIWYR